MYQEVIYIPLLEEGTEVWRPVFGEPFGDDVFRIDPDVNISDDERWAYQPGQLVHCRERWLSGEYRRCAYAVADESDSLM